MCSFFSNDFSKDFRCLNVPIAQLGFYSPLHFISCIPLELCEPFKNDRLFLGKLRSFAGFHALIPVISTATTHVSCIIYQVQFYMLFKQSLDCDYEKNLTDR